MIKSFLTYLQAIKGYSDNTITAYERDLSAFAGWLREHKEDARWSTTTREDVDAFIIEQHNKGLSAALTATSSVTEWTWKTLPSTKVVGK